jgi:hypothetical protein
VREAVVAELVPGRQRLPQDRRPAPARLQVALQVATDDEERGPRLQLIQQLEEPRQAPLEHRARDLGPRRRQPVDRVVTADIVEVDAEDRAPLAHALLPRPRPK